MSFLCVCFFWVAILCVWLPLPFDPMGVEVSEMVSFPPVAVASVDHASEDWPVRLRLKGLPGRHAEFNGDYIRQRELRAHVLACWRLEHGTCYMYLKSCPLVCFARSWTDVEQGEFFLSASLPSLQPALLWAGHLSHWELEGASASSKISLRPVLGRWDSLAPDLSMSQRPVSRRNETEAVQAGSITLPYTKGRCHQWAQNAAVAELVQNWKDEIDAGAERSGHTISDVKVCCSLKRDRSHLAVRTYHAVVCEAGSEEFILLGTMEVREENSSLALTLTNFSDKMFVEMLWDGWAGKDKQQGKRRGQFGDGLQSAVCVLSRETDIDLKILSSGHIWSFDWSFPSEVAKAHGKEALRVTTKVCNQNLIGFDCKIDTRIKVTGLQKAAFEESQFLFLCPPYEVISNTSGEILLCDDFRGCMYVREMRVLQHENRAGVVSNRQGLNITSQIPGQSRDRIGFLGEAAKSAQTFCIWMDALAGNNREVAELLYDALSDRHSLEARAFFQYATQTNQVLPSYAQLLADVCAARFPHAFPILETDYKGHKIVTQKLKKNAVNISEKLFAVLRRAPNFRTPEEYWKMQQEELAKSAERIPWTDKYDCAVRIVQAALRTQVSYEVAYDSDPGDDLSITVSGTPPEQKLVVSKVSADGPASRACIGVGSELVGRDFSDGTERITCHRLKSTIFQCRERTLSVLARMEGWRCPFKLQFLLRPAELNEQQFSLVSRDDLEVPFVTLPGQVSWGAAATRLQAAKFIINAAGCRFHDASNSYHCPYFATQGACFCGVDHLLAAVLDDLEKTFNIHLNKVQKQWVDVEKNRLLQKHEKVYKLHKQQASWSLICETSQFVVLICFGFIRLFNRCKNSSQVNSFNDWPAKAHFHSSRTCRMLCIMYDILEILFTPKHWSMWLVLVL